MKNQTWTVSTREEVIGVLWLIAGLLAFNGGHTLAGWALLIKAGLDIMGALYFAVKEAFGGER